MPTWRGRLITVAELEHLAEHPDPFTARLAELLRQLALSRDAAEAAGGSVAKMPTHYHAA